MRGTTAAINLVTRRGGDMIVGEGDEIVVTAMQVHPNIVPWPQLARRTGAALVFIPMETVGTLTPESVDSVISERTKIVAITHVSNVLGTINHNRAIAETAHTNGAY